ncbi:DUF1294 domain-containing protein [Halpernia frigidisoli]|uniref:Uncharacterized membrane protein YsdA, DUF1294 family n=1 Tax=Halpernia frigidisoli TaxID=1125876 RepID=A0A1I3DMG7_9FLAO|nr:DUF1294 domain-containing protein [Halpernia frigidisoli]SFH87915.1 Uncharacterized membrane protein YsdA, DUF1294 family [Halpernia frigidisoli]
MVTKYLLLIFTFLTFFTFGLDKWFAKRGKRRVDESILLLFTFLGGTLGAVLGMIYFKHKSSKKSFLLKFSAVVVLQLVLITLMKMHFAGKF